MSKVYFDFKPFKWDKSVKSTVDSELHWLDELCAVHGITRYKISKGTGISEQQLSKIVKRNVAMEKCNYGLVSKILEYVQFSENVSRY